MLVDLASSDAECYLTEGDTMPMPTASLLFPDSNSDTETDYEDVSENVENVNNEINEISSTIDDHQVPTNTLLAGPSINRVCSFSKNVNFRKTFVNIPESVDVKSFPPILFSPIEYFLAYLNEDILAMLISETQKNYMAVKETPIAKDIIITKDIMHKFLGINFVMAVLNFPRLTMYWEEKTRIAVIADNMSRDLFVLLRRYFKIVDDNHITPAQKKVDKLWKVRPLINCILNRCVELDRPKSVLITERIISFTEDSTFASRKPNPNGLKVYEMTSPDGKILDFEFFQGKPELISSVQRTGLTVDVNSINDITVGEASVLRFIKSVSPGTSFFFNDFFTTARLLVTMTSFGMGATGTLKKYLIPNECHLKTEKLKVNNIGTLDCQVRDDQAYSVTVWYGHKKPIFIASNEFGVNPVSTCRMWSRQLRKYVEIPRPKVIESYHNNISEVNAANQVISCYRNKSHTSNYTMRIVLYLLDLSCANSWLEYKGDCNLNNRPAVDFMTFKLQMAYSLIESEYTAASSEFKEELDNDHCDNDHCNHCKSDNNRKRRRSLPSDKIDQK